METLVAGKNKQIITITTILGIIIFCQLPTCFHVSVTTNQGINWNRTILAGKARGKVLVEDVIED